MNELENLEKQQLDNYILAVKDIITNNTNNLVDSDISSLIMSPPLESMDIIKNKLIELGKKNDLILNINNLDNILSNYRDKLFKHLSFIKKYRYDEIAKDVDDFKPVKNLDIIKITKKKLNEVDKNIVSKSKKIIKDDTSKYICSNYDSFYINTTNISSKLLKSLNSFFNTEYPRDLIDGIELKLLVKDTTLINGVKEQGERYLFTKTNSRLNDLN